MARCPPIATSDSGDGAGSLADFKAAAAVATLVRRLFLRATVITANLPGDETLTGRRGTRRELAKRQHEMASQAVMVTVGHRTDAVDHFFHGREHREMPVTRHLIHGTRGAGRTHSAMLHAWLAFGDSLVEAATIAARAISDAKAHGLTGIGHGNGPVGILHTASDRLRTTAGT